MKILKLAAFFLIVYAIGLLVGYGFYTAKRNQQPKFLWGVNIGAFGLNNLNDPYQPNNVDKQINLAKELGVNIVRVNLEVDKLSPNPEARTSINDDFIDRLIKSGLKILLIVEDPFRQDQFFSLANAQNGWSWGYTIASRYKGKIFAYQLANEVSGMTLKENHAGRLITDYETGQYAVLKNWLTGLSQGFHDGDPGAKRVISAHWIATAIIDELIKDGVNFEVIGWNWFSDMGDDPTNKAFEDGTIINVPAHFAGKNKEFWFTELNRSHGSADAGGEIAQTKYLQTTIQNIRRSPLVSGIFVYTLLDDQIASSPQDRHWGLTNVGQQASQYVPLQPKPAYNAYQQSINDLGNQK